MKILVTGGTGFIGALLVKQLVEQGHVVRVLTRRYNVAGIAGVEYVQCDLSHPESVFTNMVSGCEVAINCAGEIRDATKMHALHVTGTERLLKAFKNSAREEGKVKHWIQLSSVGAYGPPSKPGEARVVTEDSLLNPKGEYEVTKTLADQLIMRHPETSFTYSILRPSNVIGSAMPNRSFAGLISLIKKGMFFYIGSREAISTYVHVDDVVAALMLCLRHPDAVNQVFNLSNDCKLSEIAMQVALSENKNAYFVCVPEWLVRGVSKVMSTMVKWPLTDSRIDALMSQTSYPTSKIETLGFKPVVSIPSFAVEYSHTVE